MRLSQIFSFPKRISPKIFCIGHNKTGTTSLKQALLDLGYTIGDQAAAELLLHDYARRNFRPIIEYCKSAQAFQDIPFSLPYTYQILNHAFPGSKFILSVRDNENEWYESQIRFHRKRLNIQGKITKEALLNDPYRYKGFLWDVSQIVYNAPEIDPFNEAILKAFYRRHNDEVMEYFRYLDNLLVINLKEEGSYQKFCAFLGAKPSYDRFPWLNKS